MEKLIINKGYKEYQINGDENAVIRVKTTDFSLIDRLNAIKENIAQAVKDLEHIKQSDDVDVILSALNAADIKVKEQLDAVFDDKISQTVFGDMNSLSFAGGQPVALNFLDAIMPKITKDLQAEQEAAQQRISKYIEAAQQFS